MKIAVCISGQLREWEDPHPSIMELLNALDADIFISVWDKAGRTSAYDRLFGSSYLSSLFIERDKKGVWKYDPQIWSRLPTVYDLFYGNREINKNKLEAKYKPIELDMEVEPRWRESRTLKGVHYPEDLEKVVSLRHINSMPMFQKIWAVDKLARNHSTYDVLFRLRLDTCLSDVDAILSQLKDIKNDTVYLPLTDRKDFANDMFAFGSSQVMQKYSSVWENLPDYWDLKKYPNLPVEKRTAEQLLDFHLRKENVERKLLTSRCYIDERVNPISEEEILRAIEKDLALVVSLTPNEERAINFLRERHLAKMLSSMSKDELKRLMKDRSNFQYLGAHRLPALNYLCGKSAELLGMLDKAEYHLKLAHEYYGDFWPDPSNDLSRVLRKLGCLEHSIGLLAEVVSRFPKNFYSWRDLAVSYEMLGKVKENSNLKNMAITAMRIAIETSKGDFSAKLQKNLDRMLMT